MVEVEDHHAEDDGEGDQDHGEHDVVDDDGRGQRRLRDLIGQQEHEDGEGDEYGDGEGHLFSCRHKHISQYIQCVQSQKQKEINKNLYTHRKEKLNRFVLFCFYID